MTELQEPENDGINPSALLLSAWWTYKIADPLIKVWVYESVFVFHYKSIKTRVQSFSERTANIQTFDMQLEFFR